jgi:hypothetical protein
MVKLLRIDASFYHNRPDVDVAKLRRLVGRTARFSSFAPGGLVEIVFDEVAEGEKVPARLIVDPSWIEREST